MQMQRSVCIRPGQNSRRPVFSFAAHFIYVMSVAFLSHRSLVGFAGVYLFFLFWLQNIDCGYSLEPPGEAVLTCTHNLCFEQK